MTRYKVHPAVAYHHHAKPLNVSIVTETNTGIDNGNSVMVVVKKFIKDKKVSFAWFVIFSCYRIVCYFCCLLEYCK